MVLIKLRIILIIYNKEATLAGVADCKTEFEFMGKKLVCGKECFPLWISEQLKLLFYKSHCVKDYSYHSVFNVLYFYLFFGNCVHLYRKCFYINHLINAHVIELVF